MPCRSKLQSVQGSSVDHCENEYAIVFDLVKDHMAAMRVTARLRSKLVCQSAHPRLRGEKIEAAFQTTQVFLGLPLAKILDAIDKYTEHIDVGLLGKPVATHDRCRAPW